MQEQQNAGAGPATSGTRRDWRRVRWLVAYVLMALLVLVGTNRLQEQQQPCDNQLASAPEPGVLQRWVCPDEVNVHNRAVGKFGGAGLQGAWFNRDGQRGWAVGENGTIAATRDGGQAWQLQVSGLRTRLEAVTFTADSQSGWAVGEGGTILATRDGGQNWQQPQISGSKAWLQGVAFAADGQRGWAVGEGGTILATRDGGQTWQPQVSGSKAWLLGLAFTADGQRGWAVGEDGTILATRDGGRNWQPQVSGSREVIHAVAFAADGLRGWAVGDNGTVLATRDGGQNWKPQVSGSRARLLGIAFTADSQHGWVVGRSGTIIATRDGGQNWLPQNNGLRTVGLQAVAFASDGQRGWAVGAGGAILATRDGGQTWQAQVASSSQALLRNVAFTADGQHGWAVGRSGAILATRDKGQNWQLQASGLDATLLGVAFAADGRRGWAVGEDGTILATRNAGQNWEKQNSRSRAKLEAVSFTADGQRGWAVGDGGTILATRDGGQNWHGQKSGSKAHLLGLAFTADGQRGWTVGEDGAILATTDGGQTWQPQKSNSREVMHAVTFAADGQRGWAVGRRGMILTTRDGGQNWQVQNSGLPMLLLGVASTADGRRGWVVGAGGTILASGDGGQNWQPQVSGSDAMLLGVTFSADGLRGWIVGAGGTILATRDGGRSWQAVGLYRRHPPLWFLALTAALVLGGATLLGVEVWRSRQGKPVHGRVRIHADPDEPVSRTDQDRLGFGPVVDAVETFLRHENTHPPLTLAVTAPWGRGKSSLMRMLRERLLRRGAPVVWFNAWHHQKEPVMLAALLSAVVAQSTPPWLSLRGLVFRSRLVWRRLSQRPVAGLLPAALWFALLAAGLYSLGQWTWLHAAGSTGGSSVSGPHRVFKDWADLLHAGLSHVTGNKAMEALFSGEWSKFAHESFGAVGQSPDKVVPLLQTLGVGLTLFFLFTYYSRPFPARPGALLAGFGPKFNLSQAEEQTNFRERFRDHFRDVTEAFRPYTLTVFIDDLDRCESAKSAEMLEAVNYLVDSGRCFVVLGMSREIVEAQLGDAYGSLADRAAEFHLARHPTPPVPASAPSTGLLRRLLHWPPRRPEGPPTATLANEVKIGTGAATRLDYARNYLRKLIQIEIPVPAFEATHAARMTREEKELALAAEQWWERLEQTRLRGWKLLRVGLLLLLAWWTYQQAKDWIDLKKEEIKSQRSTQKEQVPTADKQLHDARSYVAFLRMDTEARRKAFSAQAGKLVAVASAPASGTVAAPALPSPGDAMLRAAEREAQLKHAEFLLARAEAAVARLEEQIRLQQSEAAKETADAAEFWRTHLAEVLGNDTAYRQSRASIPVSDNERTARYAPSTSTPSAAPQEAARLLWPQAVAVTLLLLVLTAGVLLVHESFLTRETKDYSEAVERWSKLFLEVEALRAPREVKRYLNLSRYLAVRLNATKYVTLPWLRRRLQRRYSAEAPMAYAPVPEQRIVGMTALYLAWLTALRNADHAVQRFLMEPLAVLASMPTDKQAQALLKAMREVCPASKLCDWEEIDVETFLRTVGEILVEASATAPAATVPQAASGAVS